MRKGGEYTMIRDKNIQWRRKRQYIAPLHGASYEPSGSALAGKGTGAPVTVAIDTGAPMVVRFEEAGDKWINFIGLPKDVDVEKPLYIRVLWSTNSTTATDDATFIVLYKRVPAGVALAAAATALDTPIAEDRFGTTVAKTLCKTDWGKIAGKKLVEGDMLVLETEIDATDATIASEYIFFLGLEIEYTPKKTEGASGLVNEPND